MHARAGNKHYICICRCPENGRTQCHWWLLTQLISIPVTESTKDLEEVLETSLLKSWKLQSNYQFAFGMTYGCYPLLSYVTCNNYTQDVETEPKSVLWQRVCHNYLSVAFFVSLTNESKQILEIKLNEKVDITGLARKFIWDVTKYPNKLFGQPNTQP